MFGVQFRTDTFFCFPHQQFPYKCQSSPMQWGTDTSVSRSPTLRSQLKAAAVSTPVLSPAQKQVREQQAGSGTGAQRAACGQWGNQRLLCATSHSALKHTRCCTVGTPGQEQPHPPKVTRTKISLFLSINTMQTIFSASY